MSFALRSSPGKTHAQGEHQGLAIKDQSLLAKSLQRSAARLLLLCSASAPVIHSPVYTMTHNDHNNQFPKDQSIILGYRRGFGLPYAEQGSASHFPLLGKPPQPLVLCKKVLPFLSCPDSHQHEKQPRDWTLNRWKHTVFPSFLLTVPKTATSLVASGKPAKLYFQDILTQGCCDPIFFCVCSHSPFPLLCT